MTQTQERIVDDDTGLETKRIDLKQEEYVGKSRYFSIRNWRTAQEERAGTLFTEWRADVTKYGDSLSVMTVATADNPKQIAESATAFRIKVNELLKNKDKQMEFTLRVKYDGKKNGKHVFDAEFA